MRLVKKLLWLAVALALGSLALSLVLTLYVVAVTHASVYTNVVAAPAQQVALVLGASIKSNGALSTVLEERADAAIALYKAHKVSKILVSGDNSTLEYNEVYPVGKYLVGHDIPVADIFLDY